MRSGAKSGRQSVRYLARQMHTTRLVLSNRGFPAWLFLTLFLAGAAHAQAKHPVESVSALVSEALRIHPALEGARLEARAAHDVPSQAGALPDPMFSVSMQNLPLDRPALDRSPMTGIVFGVSQTIPFPGKLGRREATSSARAAVADRETELTRAMVALAVRRAYWRLHFAEKALDITTESERLIDTLTEAVHARFAVAQAAQQDALQAQLADSRVRADLQQRRQALKSAQRALNGAVGRPPRASFGRTRAPPKKQRPRDRKTLYARAIKQNPAIVAARARIDTAQRSIAEAERDRLPDFTVGVGYRLRQSVPGDLTRGADMLSATVGVTLPVWIGRKQNARVRETHDRHAGKLAEYKAVELDVLTRLEQELDALDRLDAQIELYRREVLPQADEALDASITDYQFARVDFNSVLQNWEAELDADLAFQKLLAERAERLAVVDFLTGAAVPATQPDAARAG